MKSSGNKNLHTEIAAWSDAQLDTARAFIQAHGELIPRDLTSAQLNGLMNIARSAEKFEQLSDFLENQARKAERANKEKLHDCWRALKEKFSAFRADALNISRKAGQGRTEDQIHLLLVQRFVQHLIAENLFYQKISRLKEKRR